MEARKSRRRNRPTHFAQEPNVKDSSSERTEVLTQALLFAAATRFGHLPRK